LTKGGTSDGFKRVAAAGTLVAVGLTVAAAAAAAVGALGAAADLARPAFPSSVSAVGGVIAWAAASGPEHRFEIVVRRGGHNHALTATSAVGWIDGVKLGTGSGGHSIVVYSRCPHSPFANANVSSAGTDDCRLWWAPTRGGHAHRINAAPVDTSVGVAEHGVAVFAVQHNTARESQPARVETAQLTGTSARALKVPTPNGATIDDISANGAQVAFSEASLAPNRRMGVSEIWLDNGKAAPRLIAKVVSDTVPIDHAAQFFDGLTLTNGFVYAFLYSQSGVYPPVASRLERISLPGLATTVAPWAPSASLSTDGINATAFDPSNSQLILDLFSPQIDFSTTSASCSTHAGSATACPVVQTGPVTFGRTSAHNEQTSPPDATSLSLTRWKRSEAIGTLLRAGEG
jgi:hypothetical protein